MNLFTRWMRRMAGCEEVVALLPPAKPPADEVHDKIQQISTELQKCLASQREALRILDERRRLREPVPMGPASLNGPMLEMSMQGVLDMLARNGLTLKVVEASKQ